MFCHQIENFPGEKGDLPFVVIGIIEKAIAAQTAAGDTFDPLGFEEKDGIQRIPAGGKLAAGFTIRASLA
jgi:hypothetical protein